MASSQPPSPENKSLSLDEWIAIALAFSVIGSILFLSIAKNGKQLKITNLPSSPTSPQPFPIPEKLPESKLSNAIVSQTLPTLTISPFLYPSRTQPPKSTLILPSSNISSVPFQASLNPQPNPAKTAKISAKSSPKPQANPTKTAPIKFSDIPDKYWAQPFIEELAERKIVAGFNDGNFLPEKLVTRAELAVIIQSIATQPKTPQKPVNFKDVKANTWAVPAINKSVQAGFMKGYPENVFRPDSFVTKAQVLATLASGLKLKPPAKPTKILEIYQDSQRVPSWALKQVAAATEAELVVNYPKRDFLNPNQPATRADVAAMVYQALVKLEKAKPLSSDYIVRP